MGNAWKMTGVLIPQSYDTTTLWVVLLHRITVSYVSNEKKIYKSSDNNNFPCQMKCTITIFIT